MRYPSRRFWSADWPQNTLLTPEICETVASYGYSHIVVPPAFGVEISYPILDLDRLALLEPTFTMVENAGMKIDVATEAQLWYMVYPRDGYPSDPTFNPQTETDLDNWDAFYGDVFDEMMHDSRIEVFNSEAGSLVGWAWLTEMAHAHGKLVQYRPWWWATPSSLLVEPLRLKDQNEICALVDEIQWQCYTLDEAGQGPDAPAWLNSINPTAKLGVLHTTWVGPDEFYNPAIGHIGQPNWHDTTDCIYFGCPTLPLKDQINRAHRYLGAIKDANIAEGRGPLDFSVIQINCWYDWHTNETPLSEVIKIDRALNLFDYGSKAILPMVQNGCIPYYNGASACAHDVTHAPDTFTNTGNELILLKNVDYNDGCHVHDIQVQGNGHSRTHSVAVSPNHGTTIGPFSLEDFGELPSISYDNTNLYISVLEDKPHRTVPLFRST